MVVELVGELEGHPGVLERPHVALPEACGPRETAVDDRLKRRTRACLLESLLEQGDRMVDGLELGEENESLGAQRPDLGLTEQVGRDRPGPRPFTRSMMRTSCGQSAPLTLRAGARRRQPERLLGELGGDRGRAAIHGEPRGFVELTCDGRVGRVRREREVTGAEERILDDARDACVHLQPVSAQVPVEDR